jgi:hypothetical protein
MRHALHLNRHSRWPTTSQSKRLSLTRITFCFWLRTESMRVFYTLCQPCSTKLCFDIFRYFKFI